MRDSSADAQDVAVSMDEEGTDWGRQAECEDSSDSIFTPLDKTSRPPLYESRSTLDDSSATSRLDLISGQEASSLGGAVPMNTLNTIPTKTGDEAEDANLCLKVTVTIFRSGAQRAYNGCRSPRKSLTLPFFFTERSRHADTVRSRGDGTSVSEKLLPPDGPGRRCHWRK